MKTVGGMIAVSGILVLALMSPAGFSANGPAPTEQVAGQQAAKQSFEQISRSALEAWSQGRDDEAITLFERGLKLAPSWDEGLWYLGTIFYQKERFSAARDSFRQYLARNPQRGLGWALMGLCEYGLHDYKGAQEHLQRAEALGVERRKQVEIAVLYHKAVLLVRDGQFEPGLFELLRLRSGMDVQGQASLEIPAGLSVLGYQLVPEEIPPERREFVQKMGAAAFARIDQRRDEARNLLGQLVREYPNEAGTHYQYGSLLLEDHSPGGVEEMQKVLAISPSHPGARLKLAEYYLSRSEPEQARRYVEEVLKLEPSQPIAHLLNGQLLSAAGNVPGAIKEFESARRLAPDNSRVLWALLRAYMAEGRREDAARIRAEIQKIGEKVEVPE